MGSAKICINCHKEIAGSERHIYYEIISKLAKNIGNLYIHIKPECLINVADILVEQFDGYTHIPNRVKVIVEIERKKYEYYLLRSNLGFSLGIHRDQNNRAINSPEMYKFFEKYAEANGHIIMVEFPPSSNTSDRKTATIFDHTSKNTVPVLLSKQDMTIPSSTLNDKDYVKRSNYATGKLKRSLMVKGDDKNERFYIYKEYLENTTIR